jgi:hypothetical protein
MALDIGLYASFNNTELEGETGEVNSMKAYSE